MKTLVINGSPVKTGATAEIVQVISNSLKHKMDVKSICIDDYKIHFCKGCKTCHKTAECVQQDDLMQIMLLL